MAFFPVVKLLSVKFTMSCHYKYPLNSISLAY